MEYCEILMLSEILIIVRTYWYAERVLTMRKAGKMAMQRFHPINRGTMITIPNLWKKKKTVL